MEKFINKNLHKKYTQVKLHSNVEKLRYTEMKSVGVQHNYKSQYSKNQEIIIKLNEKKIIAREYKKSEDKFQNKKGVDFCTQTEEKKEV